MDTLVLENFIYLHIPKTAGSSISTWIQTAVDNKCQRVHKDHPLLNRVLEDIPDPKSIL